MAEIIKLSDREHLLKRPAMYVGATDITTIADFILGENEIKYGEYAVVPGLLKIINEVIDNSIDAAIRANFKTGTNISVKIDSQKVEVRDDGSGIPSQKSNGHYPAELCWGFARAGSNFGDDSTRTTTGMNGIGSFATNVYSKKFVGVSDDGKGCVKFSSKNNASSYDVSYSESKSRGTCVTFVPDLERFKLKEIDETHISAIYQRLVNLSVCYPQINFKFNNRTIKVQNFKKLAQLFSPKAEIYENSQISIAIVPNNTDDFKQYSYVNGLKIPDGGTHIDTIMSNVVSGLREKLQRKYKNIKPGDIKNKLTCIVFMRGFPNAKFNSQSKEKITNSIKEFNDFANIDYSFVNKIAKNEAIIEPITEIYKIKQEFENRKALKSITNKKKLKSEKYFRATGTPKYLCICEGFSAYGGISPVLGNSEVSYYVLKGKPLNSYEISNAKLSQNRELSELYKIFADENFDYVLGASDNDLDGGHIFALLAGFVAKFAPDYKTKFGRFVTPIKAAAKSGNLTRWVYDIQENFEPKAGEIIKYYKGLGTWQKEDLQHVIEVEGLQNMIEIFNFDSDKVMAEFLATDESDARKQYILNNNFSIAKI
mgnify:CR=1 FL=1